MPELSTVGEFDLIERLASVLGLVASDRLVLSIGDDAAVWKAAGDRLTVATADSLVEGVHFDLRTTDWIDLGWKALAENLSDIAAMGCSPRYALVGLGLPAVTQVAAVEALYAGLRDCAQAFGCQVVGGDTVRCPQVVVHVTLLGESIPVRGDDRPILTRSAARTGDLLAVTGVLGASAAGLRLLQEGGPIDPDDEVLVEIHRRPQPRVNAGLLLVAAGVRCGIDISDGLLADIAHICERSDVDAEVEARRVPVHPAARGRFGEEALKMALGGGEDYELVCAGSRDLLAAASALLIDDGQPPLTLIGSIIERGTDHPMVHLLDLDGQPGPAVDGGYSHFGK